MNKLTRASLLGLLMGFCSCVSLAKESVIVEKKSEWAYALKHNPAWTSSQFDDSTWKKAKGILGYGDKHLSGVIKVEKDNKPFTLYFRKNFQVNDLKSFKWIKLDLLRDDGAIVYLNGKEVLRSNMPEGIKVEHTTTATSSIGGKEEKEYNSHLIEIKHFQKGKNTIAVEPQGAA